MKTPSKKTIATRVGWLLAEMLVVFAGVYLAFWLSQEQAEERAEERRQQIYQTLHQTLSDIDDGIEESIPYMDSLYVEPFFPEYKQGEMPGLRPLTSLNMHLNTNLWQVMLETGGIDALDLGLIHDVHAYFRTLRFMEVQLEQAKELNNDLLLPKLGEGTGAFYNLETGQLRPKYKWYPEAVQDMDNYLRYIDKESDSLLALLEEKMTAE